MPSRRPSLLALEQLGEDILAAAVTEPHGARRSPEPEYQAWPIAVPHGRPGGQLGAVTGAATEGDAAVLAFDGHSVTVDTEPVAQRVKFPHPASHRRLLGQVST